MESIVPTITMTATKPDVVEDTFVVGNDSRTDSQPLNASTGSDGIKPNFLQILIKTPLGKTTLIWVHASDNVTNLKNNISNHIGY